MEREKNNQVEQLKVGIHKKFANLRSALLMREKLLYRQLEVVASTKQHLTECGAETNILFQPRTNEGDDLKILFEDEVELLRLIRSFGRFQLGSMVLALKQEDYITPNCDHEIMYKNIQSDENQSNLLLEQKLVSDSVLADFSKNTSLIKHNVKHINDSIVNITLEEAKKLIRKTQIINERPLSKFNLEKLDDEVDANNKSKSVSSLTNISHTPTVKRSKFVRTKPKVTINNCNRIINLRNISNVTKNCNNEKCEHLNDAKVDKNLADILELSTPCLFDSTSNQSSNFSSSLQSKKEKKNKINTVVPINSHSIFTFEDNVCINTTPNTGGAQITCDFYNRLFNEIKRNIDQRGPTVNIGILRKTLPSILQKRVTEKNNPNAGLLKEPIQAQPQLVLKNFENLKVCLKNDGHTEPIRSVHIEHWLSEIIRDTDLEPMQNNDILEHSKLK